MGFKAQYPDRTFDVGIAEEHAVSMAGGLAKQGMIPVVAIYSTFLQRSYDMIFQDVALLNLHVVFAVDRAGLVGEDGETHHGVFDVGFLRQVPGMTILCPACTDELEDMLSWAVKECPGPVAVRYPRGGDCGISDSSWDGSKNIVCHRKGDALTFVTYGAITNNVLAAAELLSQQGIEVTVLRLLKAAPLPIDDVRGYVPGNHKVIVVEETCTGSGIREALAWDLRQKNPACRVYGMDLGGKFVTHGSLTALYQHCSLDEKSIFEYAKEVLGYED